MSNGVAAWLRGFRNRRRIARARACGNEISVDPSDVWRIDVKVRGSGNVIRIGKLRPGCGRLKISLCAKGCSVMVDEGVAIGDRLGILVGQDHPNFGAVTDSGVSIGGGSGFESTEVILFNSHAHVSIGRGCMFAYDIVVHNSDAHPIYDLRTGELINPVGDLRIGDGVWVGAKATILKNVRVPDGCIIGWGSVVTGRFEADHAVIAGNPARVLPGRRVEWKRTDPRFIANERGVAP